MKKLCIAILASVLFCGCDNMSVCHIEYVDGSAEEIRCWNAYTVGSLFGPDTELVIFCREKQLHRPLASIKKWNIERERLTK